MACKSYVERTIWDGDQILLEKRADGANGLTSGQLDLETSTGGAWGEVVSLHASGIDAPVGVRKVGRTTIAPHSNWQGDYEIGTTALGYSTSNCQGGDCPVIQWPGGQENADGLAVTHSAVDTWWGSLITEKTDASGLKYMRNRYYNPQTAQFTQQDPIGLAGGINLYGFAGGDPVNFKDPLGLSPCPACAAGGAAVMEAGAVFFEGVGLATIAAAAPIVAAGAVIGGVVYATHAVAKGRVNTSLGIANAHITDAIAGPPGGGEDPDWINDKLKQAQKHINNAKKYVKDVLGKTRDALQEQIEEAQTRLEATKTGAPQP